MIDRDIGAVVVVEGTTAVGVFTERDLTRRLLDDEGLLDREVGEVMSTPVTTVNPADEVVFIFRLMTEHGIRHLPSSMAVGWSGSFDRARPPPMG